MGLKRQLKLEVPAMSSQKQNFLYCMTVISLYKTRRAFSSFDNEDYVVFINKLNPIYKLFNTLLFLRRLLNKVYNDIQRQF